LAIRRFSFFTFSSQEVRVVTQVPFRLKTGIICLWRSRSYEEPIDNHQNIRAIPFSVTVFGFGEH